MMIEKLTSRNNPKIKAVCALVSSAAERKKQSLFVAEGLRLCTDAALSGIEITETYISSDALEKYSDRLHDLLAVSASVYEITDEIAAKISDTKTPQGVFCVCKALDKNRFIDKIKYNGRYIAAEQVQNPANLGAICRTAEALGLDGVIVGGGCDIYNPKALRASMGAMFRRCVIACDDLTEFLSGLRTMGMNLLASVPDASALKITELKEKNGTVCVIGNEGNGISDALLDFCDVKVTIPMLGRAESLNAAAAASILMWELMRE